MKLRLSILIIMTMGNCVGCATTQHARDKQQATQRWKQVRGQVKVQLARQQMEGGLFEEAIHTVAEAIALCPDQCEAHVLLARAYLEQGKLASANQAIQTAKEHGLSSAALFYTEGVILEQREQLEAALGRYERARGLDPTDVDYLVAVVECLVAMDLPTRALNLLDDNMHRLDDDATVSALAGHVASLVGDHDRAMKQYGQALTGTKDTRIVKEALGLLYVHAQRYEEAINLLGPLVEEERKAAKPVTAGPRALRARALAQEIAPGMGAVRRALAIAYLATDRPELAYETLSAYTRTHTNDTLAQVLIAKASLATGDTRTALRAAQAAMRNDPRNIEVQLVRAAVAFQMNEYEMAAALLDALLAKHPGDVDAHCLLAEIAHRRGDQRAARAHFQQALQLNPTCAWATTRLSTMMANALPEA